MYVWSSLSIVILTLISVLYLFKGVVNLPTQRCIIYIKCFYRHQKDRSLQEHRFRGQIIRAAPNRSPTVESGYRRNHHGHGPRTQSEIAEATISHCRRTRRCQDLSLDKGVTATDRACYKGTFYGVKSHTCMQMSPVVDQCNLACTYCWREPHMDTLELTDQDPSNCSMRAYVHNVASSLVLVETTRCHVKSSWKLKILNTLRFR